LPGPGIAIVGSGAIAESFYIPSLTRPGSRFGPVMVIDPNTARRDAIAHQHGLTPCDSIEDAAAAGVAAAIVCAPNRVHHEAASRALRLGLDVLVEKPLTESAAEAVDLVDLARTSGRILLVNQTRRLFQSSLHVAEAIRSRRWGEVVSVFYEEGALFNWKSVEGAYTQVGLGRTGVIADLGSHVLDLIAWWLDGEVALDHCAHDGVSGPEAFARIRLSGRAPCFVRLSRLGRLSNSFRVEFERARISGDIYNWSQVRIDEGGTSRHESLASSNKAYGDFADVLLEEFHRAIATREPGWLSAETSLNGMDLIEACYGSAARLDLPWYDRIERVKRDA
jgi:predicted dehydrogenase